MNFKSITVHRKCLRFLKNPVSFINLKHSRSLWIFPSSNFFYLQMRFIAFVRQSLLFIVSDCIRNLYFGYISSVLSGVNVVLGDGPHIARGANHINLMIRTLSLLIAQLQVRWEHHVHDVISFSCVKMSFDTQLMIHILFNKRHTLSYATRNQSLLKFLPRSWAHGFHCHFVRN